VLKCSIPSFVADFVSVVSWQDDGGNTFHAAGEQHGTLFVFGSHKILFTFIYTDRAPPACDAWERKSASLFWFKTDGILSSRRHSKPKTANRPLFLSSMAKITLLFSRRPLIHYGKILIHCLLLYFTPLFILHLQGIQTALKDTYKKCERST
jgi:hypothetical protein